MKKYIAIDGKGGSGKTYFTNALGEKLGVEVLHLDEYGNDYEPFIGIPRLIEEIEKDEGEFVIYEGVGVFGERSNQFQPFRILVEVTDEVRLQRAIGRDVPTDTRSAGEWEKIYAIWKEAESKYFTDEVRDRAMVVVGDSFDSEEIVTKINNHFSGL